MKFMAMTILSMLAISATASANLIKTRQVLTVSCLSGAPVNFAETVSPGQILPGESVKLDNSSGLKTLRIEMIQPGQSYKSGNPPCPVGDILIIQIAE